MGSRRWTAPGVGWAWSLCLAFCLQATAATATGAAEIKLSSDRPRQGQTIEVTVSSWTGAAAPPAVVFNGNSYRLFRSDGAPPGAVSGGPEQPRRQFLAMANPAGSGSDPVPDTVGDWGGAQPKAATRGDKAVFRALLAIPADLSPGTYSIKLGDELTKVTVVPGQFPVQKITLPKAAAELQPSPGEREAIDKAKQMLSPARLWQGAFQVPCKGRVSAAFGLRRIVNGKLLTDYFHSGVDYAGGMGAPVLACADGKVVLAATGYRLHGNTICLDHGQGVISIYIHLSKVLVKTGQTVKAGQQIGAVGQTGRANGPHLHFSLYVNQVATNPLDWYKDAFL